MRIGLRGLLRDTVAMPLEGVTTSPGRYFLPLSNLTLSKFKARVFTIAEATAAPLLDFLFLSAKLFNTDATALAIVTTAVKISVNELISIVLIL